MIQYLRVRIGGGHASVQQLLDGLPGDHQADDKGNDVYLVATTDAGFLQFAIENQGYGQVLSSEEPQVPYHLREDAAPLAICDRCGRKSWDGKSIGGLDGVVQPNGEHCGGIFRRVGRY